MKTIITRVGFCSHCYKAQRPRTGNFFVAKGDTGWHVMLANHIGNSGFTPHLYKLIKVIGENIIYEKLCSLHDCGTDVYFHSASQSYRFDLGKWDRGVMPLTDWNKLVSYKQDSDYHV